jgi:Lon protease-like protein
MKNSKAASTILLLLPASGENREIQHYPYRLVEVERLEDAIDDEHVPDILRRQNHLGGLFARFTELATGVKQQGLELMPQLDFESLVNMVAMTLNLDTEQKQALLEIHDLLQRCDVDSIYSSSSKLLLVACESTLSLNPNLN